MLLHSRIIFLVMTIFLFSCHRVSPKDRENKTEINLPKVKNTHEVTLDNYQLSIPNYLIKEESSTKDKITFYNSDKTQLFFLSKQNCELKYSSCMVLTMQGIAKAGFINIDATDVFINGVKSLLLISHSNKIKLWSWLIHQDGFVYILGCGGLKTDSSIEKNCRYVVSTMIYHG